MGLYIPKGTLCASPKVRFNAVLIEYHQNPGVKYNFSTYTNVQAKYLKCDVIVFFLVMLTKVALEGYQTQWQFRPF